MHRGNAETVERTLQFQLRIFHFLLCLTVLLAAERICLGALRPVDVNILSPFHRICEILGTDPACTWLFDDSWYALQTAHDAGLHTVGVFSADQCGTHEQLAAYGELVVDNFLGLDVADF